MSGSINDSSMDAFFGLNIHTVVDLRSKSKSNLNSMHLAPGLVPWHTVLKLMV